MEIDMDWNLFFTIIGTGVAIIIAIIGALYGIMRNFKNDFNKKFEVHTRRFEALDNRIFQLAMGRSLKDILLQEQPKKKAKGE